METLAASHRRFLCLHLPYLATDRLCLEGELGDGPTATVQTVSNTTRLNTVNRAAQFAGLRSGITLASARAVCPDLVTAETNHTRDHALLERLAVWCDRFTPLVALDGSDGLILDITGCAHLFGDNGESQMMRQARVGLAAQGLTTTAAIASTSGAATALSRFGEQPEIRIPTAQKLADALAPLPLIALSAVEAAIGAEVLEGLSRVGLRRIGDLTGLPRASLAARFGLALARALDQTLGYDPRPSSFRPIPLPYRVRLAFPDPIGTAEDIAAALQRLLSHICARFHNEGRGCRRLDWMILRADGTDQTLTIGTARPVRDPTQLARLFAEALTTVEPRDGIDAMLLAAPHVERYETDQDHFANTKAVTASDTKALSIVLDRLTNRLGSENVFRLAPIDSHLPDRVQRQDKPLPDRKSVKPWPQTPARPLKMLHTPYPIQPLNGTQGLNAPTGFRIFGRRTLLRIIRGPERIAPEWWRTDAQWQTGVRDYFDVEDDSGRRFWIYRDHATGPKNTQNWYLQGLF
jgi:protein ImuB